MAGSGPTEDRKRALRPRDAATLVIVDDSGARPRILMGRRRPDQIFLPNKFVFPGGRVDRGDRLAPSADELTATETSRLLYDMKGRPGQARARAIALAAIRETFEETGVIVGAEGIGSAACPDCWRPFLTQGLLPRLSGMTLFARAITPPGRTRRYDTRFFRVPASHIARQTEFNDGELSGIAWVTIEEARALDIPSITRAVIEDLADAIERPASGPAAAAIPYYYFQGGTFRRAVIPPGGSAGDLDS